MAAPHDVLIENTREGFASYNRSWGFAHVVAFLMFCGSGVIGEGGDFFRPITFDTLPMPLIGISLPTAVALGLFLNLLFIVGLWAMLVSIRTLGLCRRFA